MKGLWVRYRLAAAQARARLVAAAAEAWEVPADEVEVENGVLRHESGRQATFAELAAQAEQLPVPDDVQPKDSADYKLIGREGRLRVDAVPKILGTTHFTIDQSLPGTLTAIVLHPPRFGATAAAVDDQAALAEAGVTAVVPIAEGVAVVAETFADAQRGLRALAVEWDDTNAERRSTPELLAEHVRLLESGENAVTARDDGDVDRALAGAASTVDATYVLPYLAHGPMEPNNAACRMREDGVLEVWVGTEAPEHVKMNASSIAGMRGRELPPRVDELRVADPDDGVAVGRQLPHGVRTRVRDRRARDRRRPRPRRPAARASRGQSADATSARTSGRAG